MWYTCFKLSNYRSKTQFEFTWILVKELHLNTATFTLKKTARMVRYETSSLLRAVGIESPWSGPLERVSTNWAAVRTRRRRCARVILPPQDSGPRSIRAVYRQAGTRSIGYSGFGFGHSVEVDIIVGQRTFGSLWLGPLGEVELQVDSHLTA